VSLGTTRYAALVRAVNLGGHNRLAMSDLRDLCTRLGFRDATTLLQSGNVVFRSDKRVESAIERQLEAETEKRLGLKTVYFVRTAGQWRDLVASNPFPKEARKHPGHLLVVFLKQAPPAGAVEALRGAIKGRERVDAVGCQAYIVYPDGVGRSKLTAAVIERHLKSSGTARNWNTVIKLAGMLEA
jgi:uncharacterized protein (DUF1697 family)